MIAEAWAEELCASISVAPATRRRIDLHIADFATAFFASCGSNESHALAGFFTRAVGPFAHAAAAASITRRSECDDIHIQSCITPGSVVIPVALEMAKRTGAPAAVVDRAIDGGYLIGLRLGAALGGATALAVGVWPTFFAAPLMAAATVSICLGLDANRTASALTLAAAGAGGRVGRARGQPSGRWLVFGEAVAKGCRAALAAASGFRGDHAVLSPEWLATSSGVQAPRIKAFSSRFGVADVGIKPFCAARQTINAVVAFQTVLARGIPPNAIERIEIGVPSLNAGMVARPASADDRLSLITDIRIQIAAAALRSEFLYDVERHGEPAADLVAFATRVAITPDPELDAYLPSVWAGRARVIAHGRTVEEICVSAPGDVGRDDFETVIRSKLRRMVAPDDQDRCAPLLDVMDDAGRREQQAELWRSMIAAMEPR